MQTLTLCRRASSDQGTPGDLYDASCVFICHLLELPDRGNQCNLSCILAGVYQVRYLPRSGSGRYRDVYHLQDVPGRTGILIHAGNFAGDRQQGFRTDSCGCLLPASRLGRLAAASGTQLAGLGSRTAMRTLHDVIGKQDFSLNIQEVA